MKFNLRKILFCATAITLLFISLLLSFTVVAANKSPTAQVGPQVVEGSYGTATGDFKGYVGIIFSESERGFVPEDGFLRANDNILHYAGKEEVYLTPHNLRNDNIHKLSDGHFVKIRDDLDIAFDQISNTKDISKLCPDLNKVAENIDKKYSGSDFYVHELFDLSASDGIYAKIKPEINYLRMNFQKDEKWAEGAPTVIYYNEEKGKWCLIPKEKVRLNKDGTLTIDFYDICPVAFLALKESGTKATSGKVHCIYKTCHCPSWCFICPWLCFKKICLCWIIIPIALFIVWRILRKIFKRDDDEKKQSS